MPYTEPTFRLQRDLARLGLVTGPLDGKLGPRTEAGIRAFQQQQDVPETGGLTGVVLAGLTLQVSDHLRAVPALTFGQIQAVSSHFPADWLPMLNASLVECGLHTPQRIAHYLAQIAHESAGFRTLEEFADGSAYEGRTDLGNTKPGDGPRYKGRGVIQLTGRANYRRYGELLGLDLEGDPEQAAQPDAAFRIAGLYWLSANLNTPADADDLEVITRAINGGLNGLSNRRIFLQRAQQALSAVS